MDRHTGASERNFNRACDRIARDQRLTELEKRVLCEIHRQTGISNREVTLPDDSLKLLTGLRVPQVRSAIWNLVSKGYISRRGTFSAESGLIVSYRVLNRSRAPVVPRVRY